MIEADVSVANRFLQALEACGTFAFQTFDDSPEKRGALARVMHGAELPAVLNGINGQGAGVFVTINATDGRGRHIANVTSIRAQFIDGDGVEMPAAWHLRPSIIVRRDATHWHAYWLLETPESVTAENRAALVQVFRERQKRLALMYRADPKINDLSRVMRIPGFAHCKDPANPIMVELVDCDGGRRYGLDAIMAGVAELPVEVPVQTSTQTGMSAPRTAARLNVIERAARYMRTVDPAVQGQNGSGQAFHAACVLVHGFALSVDEARPLFREWCDRCVPPWSEKEIEHKLRSAEKKGGPRGDLLNKQPERPMAAPRAPVTDGTEYEGQPETALDGLPLDLPESLPTATTGSPTVSSSTFPNPNGGLASAGGGAAGEKFLAPPPPSVPQRPSGNVPPAPPAYRPALPEGLAEKFFNEGVPELIRRIGGLTGVERDGTTMELFDGIAEFSPKTTSVTLERIKRDVMKALEMGARPYDKMLKEARKAMDDEKRAPGGGDDGDGAELAGEYLRYLGADRVLRYWREDFYEWRREKGCYTKQSDKWIESECGKWLASRGIALTTKAMGNFKLALRVMTTLHDSVRPPQWIKAPDGVDPDGLWISMRNGILNARNPDGGVLPHTPDFWCTVALPYDFDWSAACPKFEAALKRWQPALDVRDLLQDFCGYCMRFDNPFQVFLINLGEVGGDGKSTFSTILQALVGSQNCSGLGLESFDHGHRFDMFMLYGKMVNITGDANQLDKLQEGLLKSVVGGDPIFMDRKNKEPITDVLGVKLVVNCNQLPQFRDRSNAIWRRMLLVKWLPLPDAEMIADFAKTLIDEEISGIFNWALVGLMRVEWQKGFRRPDVVKESLIEAQATIQKEVHFFEECIGFDETLNVSTYAHRLMEAYESYNNENNQPAFLNAENLGKALRKWLRAHSVYGPKVKALELAGEELRRRCGARGAELRRRYEYRGVYLRTDEYASQGASQSGLAYEAP